MRIVFMGTPEFSVPCLKALMKDGHEIVGVFTQPDKPKGRKYVLTAPPVKEFAVLAGLPVFQPERVKNNPEVLETLKLLHPDCIVVVAYGKILPSEILHLPPYGCVNVHASLLPRHRGASPIQWCIVSGDRKTGVTTMLMDEGMDTGDMLQVSETEIARDETYGELHDRLSVLGADLICKTLKGLQTGTLKPTAQPSEGVTYAPIIKKEMGKLDFTLPAEQLFNLIKGFNPWPCTYFEQGGRRFKVFSAELGEATDLESGTVKIDGENMFVSCGDGRMLGLLELCAEGSKRMKAADLIRGRVLTDLDKLN